jgi:hypothetical protein
LLAISTDLANLAVSFLGATVFAINEAVSLPVSEFRSCCCDTQKTNKYNKLAIPGSLVTGISEGISPNELCDLPVAPLIAV